MIDDVRGSALRDGAMPTIVSGGGSSAVSVCFAVEISDLFPRQKGANIMVHAPLFGAMPATNVVSGDPAAPNDVKLMASKPTHEAADHDFAAITIAVIATVKQSKGGFSMRKR